MAEKRNSKKEESAWQEYLDSSEGKKKAELHKGISIGERLRRLLERLGIGKRGKKELAKKEIAAVKKEVAISAAEARKKAAKKPAERPGLKKPAAAPAGKKIPKIALKAEALRIEKYLARVEERRKAAAAMREMEEALPKPAERKPALKRPAGKKPALKKPPAGKAKPVERKPVPTIVGRLRAEARKLFVTKKVALMPKLEKPGAEAKKPAKAKPWKPRKGKVARKRKPAKKRAKVRKKRLARKRKPARRRKKARPARKRKPARERKIAKARIAKILPLRPSLAKKPISEIKKMPAEEIKKEVKLERIESRARGWFGDVLRHKKAALGGWRLRKRVRLYQLKKRKKVGRITRKEAEQMRKLLAEDRELRSRIGSLEDKIRALQRIAKQKKKEGKILEKKVKAVGIKLPEEKKLAAEKGAKTPVRKEDMQEVVKAMRSVANEMAAAATKQTMAIATSKDLLTIDDRIQAQQRLIKGLEVAFYKRKIDFDQFREKMFDYQSKLSELKIKKGVAKERKEKMTPAEREAFERQAAIRPAAGITPMAAKALEKIAEKEGRKTAEEMKKAAEKEAKKEAEKAEQKKFAERTAEALHKIAQSLGAAPRTQPPPEMPTPPPERPAPAEKPAPAPKPERPAPKPERPAPKPERPALKPERPALKPERPAPPPKRPAPAEKPKPGRKVERLKEVVVERVEKVMEGPKPKAERTIGKAIKQKAIGSGISKQQIDSIEDKLGRLVEKYGIPESTVAGHIRTLDSGRLVQDFHKLISLIEAKRESATAELIRPAPGFDIREGIIAKKREKIVGKEKQIRRARIETSFDRVLNLVQVKGIISLNEVARQLQMSKKKAQECAEILEKGRLIKLSYPPIGTVKLIYPGYLKWKAEQKRKAREAKRKKAK